MKYTTIVTLSALVVLIGIPTAPAAALSCIDPEGMIEYVVDNPDYLVVTATPTEQKEHVQEPADASDPNKAYPAGYSAQLLSVEAVHKGSSPDELWAYFERNGTWNYLCAGEPAPLTREHVYVLNQNYDLFGVTSVVAVYEADSDMAKKLLAEVTKATTEETPEPTTYETDKAYWMQNLYDQLKAMAFMVEVKMAEWKFWLGSK